MSASYPGTLLSLGSINADFEVRVNQPVGSRETLLAHDFSRLAGGKASNTAWLGACFGHTSRLLGRVGDDDLAEQALGRLRDAGVDLSAVTAAANTPTGMSMIMVPPDGKKHIVLSTNANDCWDEAAIHKMLQAIAQTRPPACLIVDYEVPAAVAHQAIDTAQQHGIAVVVDPSFPDRVEPDMFAKLLAITPNADEAQTLTGIRVSSVHQAARAARQLHESGVQIACVRLSDGGCVLAAGDGTIHVPPGQAEPTDSTGAGDAFTGVFAIALLEGKAPQEAAVWGVAAANIAVTGYGSKPAYPNREDIIRQAHSLTNQPRNLDASG
ncbi:MAG: PfkB family carbohydrate kinase [Halopseudomonas sp.]|uniref:PfkB family carbohydrate kinase n=1 Tax=Halopseudomonas sp. TaxID=2901191 RepID=UPI0030030ACE